MGPLVGLRAVEIGDRGVVAGKILADAGADVIVVEPPTGARARHTGPFVEDRASISGSLFHANWNLNKRGVTLDVSTADGAEIWRRLASTADLVIDSSGPDVLDASGAGYASAEWPAGLIWCSITPFGLAGPWRDWHVNDLVSMALGGPMMSCGYDDHELPPIRADGEQSLAMAGEWAVMAMLAARHEQSRHGLGQMIDVSIHEAAACTVEGAYQNWEYRQQLIYRQTGRTSGAAIVGPWQYRCSDGEYVLLMGGGVPRDARVWDALIAWMDEQGAAEDLHEPQYKQAIFSPPQARSPDRAHVQEVVGRFVQTLPAEEVYRRAQAIHLPWGRVRRPEENLADPHWEDRGLFSTGDLAGFDGQVRYAGAPFQFSSTRSEFRYRAPLLGEHNHEVFVQELGLDAPALLTLAQMRVI